MGASAVLGCVVSISLLVASPVEPAPVAAPESAVLDPFAEGQAVQVVQPESIEGHLARERDKAQRLHRRVEFDLDDEWREYEGDARESANEAPGRRPGTFYDHLADKAQRKRRSGGVMLGVGAGLIILGGILYGVEDDELILIASAPMWVVGVLLGTIGGIRLGVGSRQARDLYDEAKKLKISRVRPRWQLRGVAPMYSPRSQTTGVSLGFAF